MSGLLQLLNFWFQTCKITLTSLITVIVFLFISSTKASILAAFIFVIDKKTDLISAPHALVYFGIVIFFVYFKVISPILYKKVVLVITFIKLSSLLLGITDPFVPFENLFCAICMGGVFDVFQETFYGKAATEVDEEASKPEAGKAQLHIRC